MTPNGPLLSLVPARDDVIERPLEPYSRLSRHGVTMSEGMNNVNIAIFKSDPYKPPGWSTYLNGMQVDYDQFKDELRRAGEHARGMMKKAA